MARTNRVDPSKLGRPLSRHVIREGYDQYQRSSSDTRHWEEQQEHYRQGKLWYKQGVTDREAGVSANERVPTEYQEHYNAGYAPRG